MNEIQLTRTATKISHEKERKKPTQKHTRKTQENL